jgi:hypothetical protein
MTDDLTELLNQFVYDIRAILQCALDNLRDDLDSADARKEKQAANEAAEILGWLFPPSDGSLSVEAKEQQIRDLINDRTLRRKGRLAAIVRIARSTGRKRGRPKTDTAQHAIRAFTFHLQTKMSWREIALTVKGCKHKRPNPERSCCPCGDAIRDAVGRLERFLRRKGLHPEVPRRIDLERMSIRELERLWPSNPKAHQ